MNNQEKWHLLSDSEYRKIVKSKFYKADGYVDKNVVKYIDKTSNLTYYLTSEDNKRYIRCFYDYNEIDFTTFLKEMNTQHDVDDSILNSLLKDSDESSVD